MTTVRIGNPSAIEGFRDPTSDNPEVVQYQDLPGERVTTVMIPEGMETVEAVSAVVSTMNYHMRSDARPAWIECDDPVLRQFLVLHFGVDATCPAEWGSNLGPVEVKQTKKKSTKKAAAPAEAEET